MTQKSDIKKVNLLTFKNSNDNETQKQHTSDKNGSNLGDMPKGVIKVYRYHLRGLTSKEIAKLSGVSLPDGATLEAAI